MEEDFWARFTATGCVTDYLSYREAVAQRQRQEETVQGESYDGKYNSDRNDIVGTTNRGV